MVQSKVVRPRAPRRPERSITWEHCTVATGYGSFCEDPVAKGAPVSICGKHLIQAYKFCEDALDIAAKALDQDSKSDRFLRFNAWNDRHDDLAAKRVVYYALVGEFVKIGVSGRPDKRMFALKADALLATEPGSRELEVLRHEQFAHLKAPLARHREFFVPGDDLISHIEMLRQGVGTSPSVRT